MPITLPIVYKSDPKGLRKAERDLGGFKKAVGGVAAGLTASFAVAGAAIGALLVSSVKAAAERQKILSQTEAVLRSTGGAAERTAEQISDLSSRLSVMSGVDDEVIQGGQNVLLTFTKIRGVNFDRAVGAVLDMSVALGTDMQSAAIQVGKALNDPILGVTALGRAGVQFSNDQKKMIRSLVETGKTAEAQAIILEELNTQFGGSAEAFGETYAGQLGKFESALSDVQQDIGEAFLPVLGELVDFMRTMLLPIIEEDIVPLFEEFAAWLKSDGKEAIKGFITFLADNVHNLDDWAIGLGVLTAAMWSLNAAMTANPVGAVIAGLTAVVAVALWASQRGNEVGKAIGNIQIGIVRLTGTILYSLTSTIQGFINGMADVLNNLLGPVNAIRGLFGLPQVPKLGYVKLTGMAEQMLATANAMEWAQTAYQMGVTPQRWNSGQTPMMADGGVVMPSMGGSLVTVAEAGQPEVIAPLSWMEDRLGSGGGTVINLTVNAGLGTDGRSVGRLIVDEIRAFERKSGQVWVRA